MKQDAPRRARHQRRCRHAGALLVACALASVSPVAAADGLDPQALFDAARGLMKEKRFAEACPKLTESQRLRPRAGTLINLATCNKELGKSATAWRQFKEALAQVQSAKDRVREAFVKEQVASLEGRLSKLQIEAEPTPDLRIRLDEQEVASAELSAPIPVDPGKHSIQATAPDRNAWETTIVIGAEGEVTTVRVPGLTRLARMPAVEPPRAAAEPPPLPDAGATRSGLRAAGFAVGGVGLAAVGLGAAFGLMAFSDVDKAESDSTLCPKRVCASAGREVINEASTKALVSTIGFGVGAAAVGAGIVMVVASSGSSPPPERAADRGRGAGALKAIPVIGRSRGGVVLLMSF